MVATSTPHVGHTTDLSYSTSYSNTPQVPGALPLGEAGPSDPCMIHVTVRKSEGKQPSMAIEETRSKHSIGVSTVRLTTSSHFRLSVANQLVTTLAGYRLEHHLQAWHESESIQACRNLGQSCGLDLNEAIWTGPELPDVAELAVRLTYCQSLPTGPPPDPTLNPQSNIYLPPVIQHPTP